MQLLTPFLLLTGYLLSTLSTPTIPELFPSNHSYECVPSFLQEPLREEEFVHNFCESKLQGNKGPEYWNAYTSLVISVVPFVMGFPNYPLFYNVAIMLSANGFASFHYHYYLNWIGKQADEISMILANYFGMWGLINLYYKRSHSRNRLNRYNTMFMYMFLVMNTLIKNDYLFPTIYGIYVGGSLYMIYHVAQKHAVPYKRYLLVSSLGALGWIICEHHCSHRTVYGHPLWHVSFPMGFYCLLMEYDRLKDKLPSDY